MDDASANTRLTAGGGRQRGLRAVATRVLHRHTSNAEGVLRSDGRESGTGK